MEFTDILRLGLGLFLSIGMIIMLVIIVNITINETKDYNEYRHFCSDKPNFCYCSLMDGCTFKTFSSQHCINEMCDNVTLSEDTIALCNLAGRLNDKETLFEVDCP